MIFFLFHFINIDDDFIRTNSRDPILLPVIIATFILFDFDFFFVFWTWHEANDHTEHQEKKRLKDQKINHLRDFHWHGYSNNKLMCVCLCVCAKNGKIEFSRYILKRISSVRKREWNKENKMNGTEWYGMNKNKKEKKECFSFLFITNIENTNAYRKWNKTAT